MPLGDILLYQILQQKRSSLFPALSSSPKSHLSSKAAVIWSLLTAKLCPVNLKPRAGHPAWGAVSRWGSTERGFISATHWSWALQSRAVCRKYFLSAWEQESTNSHQVKDKQFSFSTAPVQQAKSSTQQDKRHWCGSSAQCCRQEWGKLRQILGKKPVFPKLSGDARSWCSQLLDVTDIFQICWRKNRWKSFALLLPLE